MVSLLLGRGERKQAAVPVKRARAAVRQVVSEERKRADFAGLSGLTEVPARCYMAALL
jgi:hypothetical protein